MLLVVPLIAAGLLALHAPLLRLPYFWDEAGHYIPAARDLLLSGDPIPRDTPSNAHPPLVMAWLALFWKIFGFTPLAARTGVLILTTFGVAGVYRLAQQVTNSEVAVAAAITTAFFPVFFAQTTLAHLDMAAAAFTIWALAFYLEDKRRLAILSFALAALAKETAIITPLALAAWEILRRAIPQSLAAGRESPLAGVSHSWVQTASLLLPVLPLAAWFAYHYARTGYIFGNPEFVRYNVLSTLKPVRILAALLVRMWQLLGYMNMFVLSLATLLAMRLPPLPDPARALRKAGGNGDRRLERPRIALATQAVFGVVILAYVVTLAVLGGAVLARYLLPVYPLVIILCVSTLWRRLPWWRAYVAVVCLGFAIALLVPPPYRYAPEDNLGYAHYVRLHQSAAAHIERQSSTARVLTAWPASDELTKPYLGYVERPVAVTRIEDFSPNQLLAARAIGMDFDLALLFSTKYELPYWLPLPQWWQRIQQRYFGYHRDLDPASAAELLGARILYQRRSGGQWVAVLRREHIEDAAIRPWPAVLEQLARATSARIPPASH